jgi:hypothetical protein
LLCRYVDVATSTRLPDSSIETATNRTACGGDARCAQTQGRERKGREREGGERGRERGGKGRESAQAYIRLRFIRLSLR